MADNAATSRATDSIQPVGHVPGSGTPQQLAALAARIDLGSLRSVHRPAKWYCRVQYRGGAFFVFEHGVVLSQWRGRKLMSFRDGQCQIKNSPGSKIFLLHGPEGRAGCWSAWWSDSSSLAEALDRLAQRNPLTGAR